MISKEIVYLNSLIYVNPLVSGLDLDLKLYLNQRQTLVNPQLPAPTKKKPRTTGKWSSSKPGSATLPRYTNKCLHRYISREEY